MISADGTAVYPWNHGETLTAAALNSAIALGGLVNGGTITGSLSVTGGGPGAAIVTNNPYGISYYANASNQGWGVADIGVAGVSRASDGNTLNAAAIGVAAAGISDKTTGNANGGAWAYYGTAQRYPGALDYSTLVFEGEIANQGTLVTTNSYNGAPRGVTSCLWVGCGGELAQLHGPVNPASAAMTIVTTDPAANPTAGTGGVFNRGIVVGSTSISGTDGTTGVGIAMSMAKGHMIQWDYDNTGARAAGIRSQATAPSATIDFVAGAMNVQDTSSHTIYRYDTPFNPDTGFYWTPASGANQAVFGLTSTQANASLLMQLPNTGSYSFATSNGSQFQILDNGAATTTNRAYAVGATTGNAPLFGARGSDTNISLTVTSKGTGQISFVTGGGTQARVLDSASSVRSVDIKGAVNGGSPAITASLGNLFLGTSGLATTATSGFIQIPTCSGTPTGVPSNAGAGATLVYDNSANRLWIYSGSTWRSAAFT